jgi:hypothetical protein
MEDNKNDLIILSNDNDVLIDEPISADNVIEYEENIDNETFQEKYSEICVDKYNDNDTSKEEKENINIDNIISEGPPISRTYGFIITRHVNSAKTNRYWNRCVKLIRSWYPYRLIVIIDDNSNPAFLKAEHNYKNLIIVQSEYPGRGELLPYIYFARNKWFNRAVIMHDSVFFHKRIPFEGITVPAISLWHFSKLHNRTHFDANIASVLNHGNVINKCLNNNNWVGCFGVQSFIKHSFLLHIMNKYKLENLIGVITNRTNRCCLERIFAIIFFLELRRINTSLFGNMEGGEKYGQTYDEYIQKLKNNNSVNAKVVKVFTGR